MSVIISVASGKGGTGKTSVALALAKAAQEPLQLLDCDVEAPNDHLFLNPEWTRKETVFAEIPRVDESLCTYCRACAEICRFKALMVLDQVWLSFPELCHSCGGCFRVCEPGALKPGKKILGEISEGWSGSLFLVGGRLRVGEPMSPPLIKEVKKRMRPDRMAILDAPPGTSCPVVETVRGSGFTLLVTEPTPFGLYDLKLAVGVLAQLEIPCGVVLNRADIGNGRVKDFLKDRGIPLLMEIPFDRRVAEGYALGQTLLEVRPEWIEKFQDLFEQIKVLIKNVKHHG